MRYFIPDQACLKWLEQPSIYNIHSDELYELDESSFSFLQQCSSADGCTGGDGEFTDYCIAEGLLSSEQSNFRKPPLKQSPQPSLRYLELQITNRCNLACRHCFIQDSPCDELSVEQIRSVLTEFEEMQGLRVMITGGEPLIHRNIDEINEMLPEFKLRKVLFTNGLIMTKEFIDRINFNEIQVSIDGIDKSHDVLRGAGSFQKAMRAIELCLSSGLSVSVSTMIHRMNLSDFDKMDVLFRNMGIRDWSVDVPCITGRLTSNSDVWIPPSEAGRFLRYGFGAGLHGGSEGYGCGLHLMSVTASGKASKCTFYSDRPAGLVSEGLRECWGRIRPVRLAELACDCKFLNECRGGCRYRAELLGSSTAKDLYRCRMYDIIESETNTA